MKQRMKNVAVLAFSLPFVFGGSAFAAIGGASEGNVDNPIHGALTAEDPTYATIADATLELERGIGITDPSAPSG